MNIFDRVRKKGYVLLPDIDWRSYDALLRDPDVGHLRLTYDQGILELQSRSYAHERAHITLQLVINTLTEAFQVNSTGSGSVALRRQDLQCGLEPDESYYTHNWQRFMRLIREKKGELDLLVDPPPDLAIEVDNPTSTLDRIRIYARLGVPELWHRNGNRLRVYLLQAGGIYHECERSPTFPLVSLEEVMSVLIQNERECDTTLYRALRQWVRDHIPADQRSKLEPW